MKAFSTTMDNEGFQIDHQGMDLRDYFAAQAMQGMLTGNLDAYILKSLALDAYDMANAMMEVRNESK